MKQFLSVLAVLLLCLSHALVMAHPSSDLIERISAGDFEHVHEGAVIRLESANQKRTFTMGQ